MTEIQRRQVEEVDNQDQFSPVEMSSNEEHNEAKLEKIVEYKVASYACSSIDVGGVVREEVPHVCDLEDEEGEPTVTISIIQQSAGWYYQ